MALAPKFVGHKLPVGSAPSTQHTLELYLDYVCPFSAKMFKTIYNSVQPLIAKKYSSKVQIIFRQQVQPWHPSSTLTHESAAAVLRLSPEKFWPFSSALFAAQADYFDINVVNETRNQTYGRLAEIAGSVGVDKSKVLELLRVPEKPAEDGYLNVGNGVTDDVKMMVKAARFCSIHVSPTVVFNGIEEKSISSSFTAEQWEEWLQKNVV